MYVRCTLISSVWQNKPQLMCQLHFNIFRARAQILTEMHLAIIPSISYEPKAQTSARHPYTLSPWRQVPWFDRVWASIWSGRSRASRRGMTCDKWVLSGGCGVGKLTLFPSDYISRQENGTWGEWLEFHRTRGRRSFSLVCRLIKRPGGGIEEVRSMQTGHVSGQSTICYEF